jgi:hypothetical protein
MVAFSGYVGMGMDTLKMVLDTDVGIYQFFRGVAGQV